MKNNISIISKDICTGCKLCANICPKTAISFSIENDGFWIPKIDLSRCINCGLCYDKCIVNNLNNLKEINKMGKSYAVWTKNNYVRMNSTSGGVFYSLATYVISKGGSVCACSFTDNFDGAIHIIGNTFEIIRKTMRSKYIQSDMGTVYSSVKDLLDKGKLLLFTGTPCQVDAIRTYLPKSYPNLLLCDFVCRGVNSPKAYRYMLSSLEQKYHSKVKFVQFKNKNLGWTNLSTCITFENGKQYYGTRFYDPWINGYIGGHLYMRKCCYHCNYTSVNRYSDITIGDFWGYKDIKKIDKYMGVSFLTTNTKKGMNFIKQIEKGLVLQTVDITTIIKGNGCLNGSFINLPEKRNLFFSRCENEPFDKVVFDLLGWSKIDLFYKYMLSKYCSTKMKFKNHDTKKLSQLIEKNMEKFRNVKN